MTVIQHTYNVHDKQGFLHNLNKIVKRYKVQVNVVWGEPNTYKTWVQTPYGDMKVTLTKHPVTVDFSFDQFRVEGFTYLGCIKDENMMGLITIHGNDLIGDTTDLTTFVNQFEDIPCHNCGRKHRRKIGHVFRVNETGEFIVFGSACAKNYFGINFDRILKFFERVNIVFTDGWDGEYIRGLYSNIIDWRTAAKYAYYIIQKDGYLSGSKAREQERNSTGDWVREMMNVNEHVITNEVRRELREMTENNQFPDFDELVTTDFINGKTEGLNDFEHNLVVLQEKMNQNMVTFHSYGWIAYLVFKKWFYTEDRPQRREFIIPDWATDGRRVKKGEMEAQCTVTGAKTFNTSYGLTHLYTFEWADIRFKWFSSNDMNIEVGDEVILNGFTVKKTEDNQYGKSVIINRARLEKLDGTTTRPEAQRAPRVHVSQEDRDYFSRLGIDDI